MRILPPQWHRHLNQHTIRYTNQEQILFDQPREWEELSLVAGGGSALFEVLPRGIFIQHICAIGGPRHNIQSIPRLQWILTPRPCLVLGLLQRAGCLHPQQCPRAHKDWQERWVGQGRKGGGAEKEEIQNENKALRERKMSWRWQERADGNEIS